LQTAYVSLFSLFFSSIIMGVAMALAWGSFGRPRHVLNWSLAFGSTSVQILGGVIAALVPRLEPYWWPFNDLLVIIPASLVAIGARQRMRLPDRMREITVSAAIVWALILVSSVVKALDPVRETLASLYTMVMLVVAARAIRPFGRRPDPAERAMMLTLLLFAAFEMVLVVLIFLAIMNPADTAARARYHLVYYTGLPPIFVAAGIGAVLLTAADLAARLRRLAARDPLTNVHNRRGFREAAERMIANGKRQRLPIAIALADIDHFKAINDRFGHTTGDRTLDHISRTLVEGIRLGDLVGRIGGEEFALILVDSSGAQAAEVMERIRETISNGFADEDMQVPVTTSFGVAEIEYGGGLPRDLLAAALESADRALYQSKVGGRNRVTLATPTGTASVTT
jgi:diguanylate cyclase (GGDEF)-like protein